MHLPEENTWLERQVLPCLRTRDRILAVAHRGKLRVHRFRSLFRVAEVQSYSAVVVASGDDTFSKSSWSRLLTLRWNVPSCTGARKCHRETCVPTEVRLSTWMSMIIIHFGTVSPSLVQDGTRRWCVQSFLRVECAGLCNGIPNVAESKCSNGHYLLVAQLWVTQPAISWLFCCCWCVDDYCCSPPVVKPVHVIWKHTRDLPLSFMFRSAVQPRQNTTSSMFGR